MKENGQKKIIIKKKKKKKDKKGGRGTFIAYMVHIKLTLAILQFKPSKVTGNQWWAAFRLQSFSTL